MRRLRVSGFLASYTWGGRTTLSLWDTETSGTTYSSGGTGKTIAEMQTESTFTDAGWDILRKVIGIPDLRFHDLRKTFCSILAQNGISTAVTQKPLGHSSPDLTKKVYTNVDPVLRQAVDRMPASDWLQI